MGLMLAEYFLSTVKLNLVNYTKLLNTSKQKWMFLMKTTF